MLDATCECGVLDCLSVALGAFYLAGIILHPSDDSVPHESQPSRTCSNGSQSRVVIVVVVDSGCAVCPVLV